MPTIHSYQLYGAWVKWISRQPDGSGDTLTELSIVQQHSLVSGWVVKTYDSTDLLLMKK